MLRLAIALPLVLVHAQAGSVPAARPAECAPLATSTAGNVWERAKYPALRRYCDLLASGAAKLASGTGTGGGEAREAIASADEASRALPGHAAPGVLRGRALVALGQFREGVAAIEEALAIDPRALEDPQAIFAWGRALGRVGRYADAEAAFHALLPRAAGLTPAERGKAEIEAALLAETRGPAGLGDAIALFRQARRDGQDALLAMATMGLALALDRAGEHDEARAEDAGRQDPRDVLKDARAQDALADVGATAEGDALVALALRERDPAGAREAWKAYLAGGGGKGPWAEHARACAAGGGGKRR